MPKAVSASLATVPKGGFDRYLIWVIMLLCAAGIVAVYSAVAFLAETKADGNTEVFLLRHVAKVVLAFGAMIAVSLLDYRKVARFARPALLVSIGLLVLVQVAGVASGGAARWLDFEAFTVQPSDLARVALILYLAVLLARKQEFIKSFKRSFVPAFFWILGTVALIGLEDLSTAALVLVSCVLMCFVARAHLLHLTGLATVCLLLALALVSLSPSRAARVEAYLGVKIFPHTEATDVFDPQNEGFQAEQARIAFALGGLTGVGPGKSTQRDFLPAPYNDFIFAIIAEEYGLVGAVGLLGLFVAVLFRGLLRIARRAVDPLGLFLAVGLTTMLVLYGFVHAGVACGLLPVTGLPMPFVSYGGTSMVANGVVVGLLLSISRFAAPAS